MQPRKNRPLALIDEHSNTMAGQQPLTWLQKLDEQCKWSIPQSRYQC